MIDADYMEERAARVASQMTVNVMSMNYEKELSDLRKRIAEQDETIRLLTTDPNHEGGVQWWSGKAADLATENLKLAQRVAELESRSAGDICIGWLPEEVDEQ